MKVPKLLESLTRKSLGEQICKLLLSINVVQNINLFHVVLLTDQIVFGLDVLGPLVVLRVFN